MDIGHEITGNLHSTSVGMGHQYTVLIDSVTYHFGSWAKASGLSVNWTPCEYRTGDQGNMVWLAPGLTKYEPIALSRAACAESRIVQYWLSSTAKNPQPLSGTIQLINWLGTALVEWRLNEFFPIGWSIDAFDASGGKPAMETLKLAHTGFLGDEFSMLNPF